MRVKSAIFVSAALTCFAINLHAASLVLNASGTIKEAFQGNNPVNGTFNGTVTFDTVTNQALAENIIAYFNGSAAYTFAATSLPVVTSIPPFGTVASNYSLVKSGYTTVQVLETNSSLAKNALNFSVSDALLTSSSSEPMIEPYVLQQGTENVLTIGSGTLTNPNAVLPVAPTPEPSSLILLGTGVIGLFGIANRRFLTL